MTLFRIKLIGCLESSPSVLEKAQERISQEFGLSIETVNLLFQRLPAVFKDNLSKADAEQYCEFLTTLGVQVTIESASAKVSEKKDDGSELTLSLVATDFETGTIENLTIASEKSLASPEDSLSFEFSDDEISLDVSEKAAPQSKAISSAPKSNSLSIVEELSELSLTDLDFEPSEKAQEQAPEIAIEQALPPQESAIEEDVTPRDPYATDLPVGKYQTEPFNEITDPLQAQSANSEVADDTNSAFGKNVAAAFASTSAPTATNVATEALSGKTSSKKNRYLAFAVVAIVLAAAPMFFLSSGNIKQDSPTTLFSQIESLLKQQKDITAGDEQQTDALDLLPPVSSWNSTSQRDQFSVEVSLTMRGKLLNTISLILREQEPEKLTPKQIVDKVSEPLWLDRFDLSEDLSKNPLQAQALELKGRAYIRQRNSATPARRVIAPVKITATTLAESSELQLTWEISYGLPEATVQNKAFLLDNQRLVARYTDTITLTPKK